MIFKNVDICFDVQQKCDRTPVAANLGYEIPAHLYSLFKPTRTLIAKAIGREKGNLSLGNTSVL